MMAVRDTAQLDMLRRRATVIRRHSLQMTHRAGMGHPGGDLSASDILATLYSAVLKVDPAHPRDPRRDRFVMSKGHASGALYATLAGAGFFPEQDLQTYMQPLSRLNGHPANTKLPGVEASTGPLGHGLPIAVGMAIGAKLLRDDWRTFVLVGDGELEEGSNWEAAMVAAHRGLDNLTLVVDRNGLQQGDTTHNTSSLEPLGAKWQAFGWAVQEVDGHDHAALLEVLSRAPQQTGKPTCIIANTHKGHPVSFITDRVEWHHHVPSEQELAAALLELGGEQ
jgi:transketolase